MKYGELAETVLEIIENKKINKEGLSILYELPESDLRWINEELYYLDDANKDIPFIPEDAFEVIMWGILIKFRKKI